LSPDLATALREETPAAPSQLRERLGYITATTPPPRRTPSLRRVLLWAAPVALTTSCLAALAVGLNSALDSKPASRDAASATSTVEQEATQLAPATQFAPALDRRFAPRTALKAPGTPAPTRGRAQQVQATLRVLVDDPDDLSAATQRALRTTRRLGGYLVAVDYGTPEPSEGTASLRIRVPVTRVQAAIVNFSDLGRILAQQTRITDLQQQLDELTRQLRRAKGDKTRAAILRRERIAINRRAAYATVDLALTTHEPEQKVVPPSRLDRAVDDATGVLTAELAIAAYILIVAAPFLVLLAAAFAGSRAYRRHADQRLLERA
jgi:hypothetical protein